MWWDGYQMVFLATLTVNLPLPSSPGIQHYHWAFPSAGWRGAKSYNTNIIILPKSLIYYTHERIIRNLKDILERLSKVADVGAYRANLHRLEAVQPWNCALIGWKHLPVTRSMMCWKFQFAAHLIGSKCWKRTENWEGPKLRFPMHYTGHVIGKCFCPIRAQIHGCSAIWSFSLLAISWNSWKIFVWDSWALLMSVTCPCWRSNCRTLEHEWNYKISG